ncbi:fimbrial assembly protein, partial [Cronobacter sakazakii]
AQTFVWPLKITAAVQATNTLNISDDTSLTGSATITVMYL